jgi:hypothetical protein
MARKQTRRTVSLNRDIYERAKKQADREGKSLAHAVTDALLGWLKGKAPDLVHMDPDVVGRAVAARERKAQQFTTVVSYVRAPFCAVCAEVAPPYVLRPLGKNDTPVAVCKSCDTVHPRSGRISFVESSKASARPAKAKGVPA